MKKLICILLLAAAGKAFAQPKLPGGPDYNQTLKGAMVDLQAEKNAMDPGQVQALTVTISLPGTDGKPATYDYRPANLAAAPWTVTGWKIVEGGGGLSPSAENGNAYTAIYAASDNVPPGKCVIIEVTMVPRSNRYPKTILRKTVYINDDQNIFYFDCKAFGINNEKYTVNSNGGTQAKMEALQKQVAALSGKVPAHKKGKIRDIPAAPQSVAGMDLAVLTGNARGVYMLQERTTTLTITGDQVTMVNGVKTSDKRNYLINISFPGQSTGAFSIKSRKEVTAAIVFPMMGKGCGCHDSPEEQAKRKGEPGPTCMGGVINITKYDKEKKIVEGNITANLEGIANRKIIYGNMSGKFSVVLAN